MEDRARSAGSVSRRQAAEESTAEPAGGRQAVGPQIGDAVFASGRSVSPAIQPLEPNRSEALWRVHEAIARGVAERLGGKMDRPVHVQIAQLQVTSTAKLLLSRRAPTCFAVLAAQPLQCRLLLEIEPAILYPLMDGMLGAASDPSPIPCRPMTELESILARRIVHGLIGPYASAWEHVLSLELEIERIEHNPLMLRHLPALASVLLASWSLRMDAAQGCVHLAVPLDTILLMTDKLATRRAARGESLEQAGANARDGVKALDSPAAIVSRTESVEVQGGWRIDSAHDSPAAATVRISELPASPSKASPLPDRIEPAV